MAISFFNTLSGRHEDFIPLSPQQVTMYVCGPTVYNYIHIGNARPLVIFDVLFRLLKLSCPQVKYIRNITDIDDKIIKTAQDNGQSIAAVSEKFTRAFHQDIEGLNLLPPTAEPYATEHIPQMIKLIEQLIHNNYAYEAEKHILFDVSRMPTYGQLSKRKPEDMLAGARVDVAPYKKDPADFILWKPSTTEQPGWDSPWGYGRPGWHLECSVMAESHLGKVIDIHGGGQDLIFPHHENEIAQSCCAHNNDLFARYWLHNGYINVDGKKMSKSLNNFFTLREVLDLWHGEVIRYTLLSTHYRKPMDWKTESLEQAKINLDKLYRVLKDHAHNQRTQKNKDQAPDAAVVAALENDLNTPQAIAELHKLAQHGTADKLIASAHFLGLLQNDPDDWFKWQAKTTSETPLSVSEIDALIAERNEARRIKDYKRSDAIRKHLEMKNIILEDRNGETSWRKR